MQSTISNFPLNAQYSHFFEKSPFAFGGGAISGEGGGYGFGRMSENESLSLLEESFAKGITIFDTAPIYGFGESEQRLGKFIKKNRLNQGRCDVVVISKSGVDWHPNKRVNMTNDPQNTIKMFCESLKRLQLDFIPLYLIHWPDQNIDIRLPLEALLKEKEKGLIGEIGLANTTVEDFSKALELMPIHYIQSQLNLYDFSLKSTALLLEDRLQKKYPNHCPFFMGWGPLDKGILSNTVFLNRKYEQSDCRSHAPWWKQQNIEQKLRIRDQKFFPSGKKFFSSYATSELLPLLVSLTPYVSEDKKFIPLIGIKSSTQLQSALESLQILQTFPKKDLLAYEKELIALL